MSILLNGDYNNLLKGREQWRLEKVVADDDRLDKAVEGVLNSGNVIPSENKDGKYVIIFHNDGDQWVERYGSEKDANLKATYLVKQKGVFNVTVAVIKHEVERSFSMRIVE